MGPRRRPHALGQRQGVRRVPALRRRTRDRRAAARQEERAALRRDREAAPPARPLRLRTAPGPLHRRGRRPGTRGRRADRVRARPAHRRRRPLYRELVKTAIKRTHNELQAKAETVAKDKKTTRARKTAADPITAAKRERDTQLRELTDQAHGANSDLGHALMHSLAAVDPTDLDVARFFVLCGCRHRTNYADRVTMPMASHRVRPSCRGVMLRPLVETPVSPVVAAPRPDWVARDFRPQGSGRTSLTDLR